MQEVKDLCTENYKTLMTEIEEDTINGKISHVHGLDELILIKCPCHLKKFANSMQFRSKTQ
jgi:hypothetical protein